MLMLLIDFVYDNVVNFLRQLTLHEFASWVLLDQAFPDLSGQSYGFGESLFFEECACSVVCECEDMLYILALEKIYVIKEVPLRISMSLFPNPWACWFWSMAKKTT
jgi:hypothetical protein